MVKQLFLLLMMTISSLIASAEELYVNAKTGNDKNTGSQSQPLKTLGEAANRINANTEKKAAILILSEGVYALTETVLFNNNKFSAESRLTIWAEILPNDVNWNPQRMPVITTIIPATPTPVTAKKPED
jgi:hypothetical protein